MSNGIEIHGMDEFTDMLKDMTIDKADEMKAVRSAIKPMAEEVSKNSTKRTGKLSKISKTVKKEGLTTVGVIKTKMFYDLFEEFGTSMSKHNVGYFERSVKKTENKALQIIAQELLNKVK